MHQKAWDGKIQDFGLITMHVLQPFRPCYYMKTSEKLSENFNSKILVVNPADNHLSWIHQYWLELAASLPANWVRLVLAVNSRTCSQGDRLPAENFPFAAKSFSFAANFFPKSIVHQQTIVASWKFSAAEPLPCKHVHQFAANTRQIPQTPAESPRICSEQLSARKTVISFT